MRTKNNRRPRKVSARRANRARRFKGKELERICNKAALKFDRRMSRHAGATFADARQVAAEVGRTTARRYMIAGGTDEHDLLRTCLAERAESYRAETSA